MNNTPCPTCGQLHATACSHALEAATQPAPDVAALVAITRRAIESAHYEGFQDGKTGNTYSSYDKSKALANSQSIATALTALSAQLQQAKADMRLIALQRESDAAAMLEAQRQNRAFAAKLAVAERERDEYKSYKDRVEVSERERDTDRARLHASDDLAVKNAIEREAYKESAQGAGVVIHRMGAERDALAAKLAEAEQKYTSMFEERPEEDGWCEHNRQFHHQVGDEDNSDGCMQCERDAAIARAEAAEAELAALGPVERECNCHGPNTWMSCTAQHPQCKYDKRAIRRVTGGAA